VTRTYTATIAHFFCGSGGGGLGSAEARAQLGGVAARFRVLGGIDVDRQACDDFERLVGAPVADQLRNIRHWRLIQDSYEQASEVVAGPATWFVDPPYEGRAGRAYRGTRLDYDDLARWVEGLRGQVIVCEAAGADWLPFTPIWQTRGIKGRSREAVYVRYSEARP
jgi:hypothetical protein